jgi:hypothetical protein
MLRVRVYGMGFTLDSLMIMWLVRPADGVVTRIRHLSKGSIEF